jgi:hypothetical protein
MIEIRATLRVFSNTLPLSMLTELLGPPSTGVPVGEAIGGRKPREQTLWARESDLARADTLDAHLSQLLDLFSSFSGKFERVRDQCTVDLFCMLSTPDGQGGAQVSASNMSRMAEYEAKLVLDVYGGGEST